ncbi:MAG TPA: hypothetical protein VKW09_08255 [bacterium]|nr:hypothetical protein [bacterium]
MVVSYGALFVSLVPRDRYVEGNVILNRSRALSLVGGPGLGGLLVQMLSAPFAIAADAVSFLASAFFLGRISPAEPPPPAGNRVRSSRALALSSSRRSSARRLPPGRRSISSTICSPHCSCYTRRAY